MSATKQKDPATDWLGSIAKIAGGLVLLLGGVVVTGWFVGSATLIQLRPQLVPMQFNTALGFVLGATGLLSLLYNRLRLAMACGSLLAGFALLTLLQYPLGADFGIDLLLFEPDITTKSVFPGRMAPATALAHFLGGLALLALTLDRLCQPRVCVLMARIFGMGILALGLGNLLGYAVGKETPYDWLHSTYMAVHTSGGFILLGVGLLAFVWRQMMEPKQGNPGSPALESSIGLAVLVVILWQSLLSQERLQSMHFVENQAANLSAEIEHNINHQIQAVNRMARRWEDRGGTPQALWRADAARYLQHNQGLQAISWVDSSMHVRWIEPLQGNEAAMGLYLPFEPRRTQALETARLKRAVAATRNIELVQGGRAVIAYFPLYLDDRFDGYIGAVFHINRLIDPIVTSVASKGFGLELFEGNEEIYRRVEPGAVYESAMSREHTFGIVNLDWRLQLQPSQALLAERTSSLPLVELVVGLLLALLLGLAVDRAHAARQRAVTLAIEVAERKSAQKSLAKSELWQRSIFNALEEGVMVATPDRLMVDMNPACQAMLGYSQAEMAGQSTAMVHVDHDHVVEFGNRIKAAFDKGEAAHFEFEVKRKNGEVFPTEHTVSLIKNAQGEAVGIVSALRDITARKQAEVELHRHREHLEELVAERTRELEATNAHLLQEIAEHQRTEETLAEREQYLQAMFDNMQEGVIVTDETGVIESANPAALAMFGYDHVQLVGQDVVMLMPAPEHDQHSRALKHYLEQNGDKQAHSVMGTGPREVTAMRADGSSFPMSLTLGEMWFTDQRKFIAIVKDVTESKQIQRALEHSRQQLRNLAVHLQTVREEERTRIARDVHDELGQVLTALNMNVHWLMEHVAQDQTEMKRRVLSMSPLTASAIESVQRITSELRPAMLDELGLGPAIQWYVDEFQERTDIECDLTMVFDDMQIGSDRSTAVFRILQEALTNVARHARASRVSVDIRGGEDRLHVQITDNGRGISPSAISADNAFGLLGMKERALALGGRVDIEGRAEGGTTILLYLPLGSNPV